MNTETERMICENCGCVIDEEKTENIIECSDGSVFCSEECANANDYYRCNCCGAYVKDAYYIEDTGEDICQDCFYNDRDYFQCDDCGKYFSSNSLGKYDDWNAYCEKCSQEYIYCEDCGAVIHINDEYLIDGNYYCSYCAENHLHGSDLYDYGYKPCPEFYGDTGENNQLFIGVELEVDKGDSANKLYCELGGFEEIYCKHDGSLGNECEHICIHCYYEGEYFRCDHCDRYFSDDALGIHSESCLYCDNCSDDYVRCEDCDEILHYSNPE